VAQAIDHLVDLGHRESPSSTAARVRSQRCAAGATGQRCADTASPTCCTSFPALTTSGD
jgi:hypothetical protein